MAKAAASSPDGSRLIDRPWLSIATVLVFGSALAAGVHWKAQSDRAAALEHYRAQANAEARNISTGIDDKLRLVQQGLRTISLLPSVRNIDRFGQNLNPSDHRLIQQLYTNLNSQITVSEIYIVPVDLAPDHNGEVPDKAQQPILMFDHLITSTVSETTALSANLVTESEEGEDTEEVEVFEYRELRDQLDWLKTHQPTDRAYEEISHMMLTSREVITCDNTLFDKTHKDADRVGVVLSVPFYDPSGNLKGTVSAIIKSVSLAEFLPQQNYALLNSFGGVKILSKSAGVERASVGSLNNAQPNPDLFASSVVPLSKYDPRGDWKVWSGRPKSEFLKGHELRAIRTFETFGYLALIAVGLAVALVRVTTLNRVAMQHQSRRAMLGQIDAMTKTQMELAASEENARQLIEELLLTESALIKAKDAAEAGAAAKSAFLAAMSHEIRTPLNGVLGMVQVMAHDKLSPAQAERLAIVQKSGTSLLTILNDILDLSKIEAGKFDLELTEFNLAEITEGVHATSTLLASEKDIGFAINLATSAQGTYRADASRIRQILYNLTSNAIKFTGEGHVALDISRPGDELVIRVSDTGIGIPADRIDVLFDRFVQADLSTTRKYGGAGLGLAICKELVTMMQGKISVLSAPGEGSTFTVTLPIERIGDAGKSAPTVADIPKKQASGTLRVLAAEDNEINQMVLKTLLLQVGIEVSIVENGKLALEAWRAAPWDLILMDIQMPEMDGPTAVGHIRQEETALGRARTPIIAVTANTMTHQLAAYREIGVDVVVSKPIQQVQLFEAIDGVLEDKATPDDAAAQGVA